MTLVDDTLNVEIYFCLLKNSLKTANPIYKSLSFIIRRLYFCVIFHYSINIQCFYFLSRSLISFFLYLPLPPPLFSKNKKLLIHYFQTFHFDNTDTNVLNFDCYLYITFL